jgi:putative addiction module antidote
MVIFNITYGYTNFISIASGYTVIWWVEMSLTIPVKVVKIGNSLRMTIPKPVAQSLGIREGDLLDVGVSNGSILAKRADSKESLDTIFGIEKRPSRP